MDISTIFKNRSASAFNALALEVFKFQFENNAVYHKYCELLHKTPNVVKHIEDIPFLPIEFFKTQEIITGKISEHCHIFTSSGTTGSNTSKHFVSDIEVYKNSFTTAFNLFYGAPEEFTILALLPSYLERKGSSLIVMVDALIKASQSADSGFYLNDLSQLKEKLVALDKSGKKVLLIGVSFALLDLVEFATFNLKNTTIMETGGMKGKRKEMVREELHEVLKQGFGVTHIHSEYGMTELLSQAYSNGNGIFTTPPWMRVLTRDTEDPLTILPSGKTGGLNIIDLANINSCAFIATQDLGRIYTDSSFEVIGRFDHADVRGCNLMVL